MAVKEVLAGDSVHSLLSILDVITVSPTALSTLACPDGVPSPKPSSLLCRLARGRGQGLWVLGAGPGAGCCMGWGGA